MTTNALRIGILTAGTHPVQTIYLPALHALPTLYTIISIYDASQPQEQTPTAIPANGASTTATPAQTPDSILSDPTITLILNFMPNEYHELYTIAALQAGKHVMVETPVSLSIPSAKRIIAAEKDAPNSAKVFVASARRYAPCFEGVFKREVASLERIHYARCRMIAGPHVAHTATAAACSRNGNNDNDNNNNNNDVEGGSWTVGAGSDGSFLSLSPSIPLKGQGKEKGEDRTKRLRGLLEEVFGKDETPSPERIALSRFLASLGCHDLGLMRDTLGYPDTISNISVNEPFYSALFHYNGGVVDSVHYHQHPHPFTLMYETGTDCVPRCDAQLAVYGQNKTVTIHYDLPYARGQPMRVVVETADERGGLLQTETVSTWEEAYQEELKALHGYLVEGKPAKTTATDSLQDIKLFQMIFAQYDRQCGTIRTPLG